MWGNISSIWKSKQTTAASRGLKICMLCMNVSGILQNAVFGMESWRTKSLDQFWFFFFVEAMVTEIASILFWSILWNSMPGHVTGISQLAEGTIYLECGVSLHFANGVCTFLDDNFTVVWIRRESMFTAWLPPITRPNSTWIILVGVC